MIAAEREALPRVCSICGFEGLTKEFHVLRIVKGTKHYSKHCKQCRAKGKLRGKVRKTTKIPERFLVRGNITNTNISSAITNGE